MDSDQKEINKGNQSGQDRTGHLPELWEGATRPIFLLSEDNDVFICSYQSISLQLPLIRSLETAVPLLAASFQHFYFPIPHTLFVVKVCW